MRQDWIYRCSRCRVWVCHSGHHVLCLGTKLRAPVLDSVQIVPSLPPQPLLTALFRTLDQPNLTVDLLEELLGNQPEIEVSNQDLLFRSYAILY
jgi:hypothetical protein